MATAAASSVDGLWRSGPRRSRGGDLVVSPAVVSMAVPRVSTPRCVPSVGSPAGFATSAAFTGGLTDVEAADRVASNGNAAPIHRLAPRENSYLDPGHTYVPSKGTQDARRRCDDDYRGSRQHDAAMKRGVYIETKSGSVRSGGGAGGCSLYPDLRKTRLCPNVLSKGVCGLPAEECRFAHSYSELRFSYDRFYKILPCAFFERGKCRNGEFCRFAHGSSDIRRRPAQGGDGGEEKCDVQKRTSIEQLVDGSGSSPQVVSPVVSSPDVGRSVGCGKGGEELVPAMDSSSSTRSASDMVPHPAQPAAEAVYSGCGGGGSTCSYSPGLTRGLVYDSSCSTCCFSGDQQQSPYSSEIPQEERQRYSEIMNEYLLQEEQAEIARGVSSAAMEEAEEKLLLRWGATWGCCDALNCITGLDRSNVISGLETERAYLD